MIQGIKRECRKWNYELFYTFDNEWTSLNKCFTQTRIKRHKVENNNNPI